MPLAGDATIDLKMTRNEDDSTTEEEPMAGFTKVLSGITSLKDTQMLFETLSSWVAGLIAFQALTQFLLLTIVSDTGSLFIYPENTVFN